jgi:hypothetical protein
VDVETLAAKSLPFAERSRTPQYAIKGRLERAKQHFPADTIESGSSARLRRAGPIPTIFRALILGLATGHYDGARVCHMAGVAAAALIAEAVKLKENE